MISGDRATPSPASATDRGRSARHAPWRPIVTLSKPTAVSDTPGMISSPTTKLICRPSGRAMIAEPRPVARSSRVPNKLEVQRRDDRRPARPPAGGRRDRNSPSTASPGAAEPALRPPVADRPDRRRQDPEQPRRLHRDQQQQDQLRRRIDGRPRQPAQQHEARGSSRPGASRSQMPPPRWAIRPCYVRSCDSNKSHAGESRRLIVLNWMAKTPPLPRRVVRHGRSQLFRRCASRFPPSGHGQRTTEGGNRSGGAPRDKRRP